MFTLLLHMAEDAMWTACCVTNLVQLNSPSHGLGQTLSERANLISQPLGLLLKVLGNVLSSRLQLLLVELLRLWHSLICNLHKNKSSVSTNNSSRNGSRKSYCC